MRRGKPSGGPWYDDYKTVWRFERGAKVQFPTLRVRNTRLKNRPRRIYNLRMEVPNYAVTRSVEIKLGPSRRHVAPAVTADGPESSKHRYKDGSLCMWYPYAARSERWTFEDGLLHLLVMTQAHLFREEFWRETGEWLGPEHPHEVID